jgi:hypothetical protein
MPMFRKKPVKIEALRYTGDNAREVVAWARSHGNEDVQEGAASYEGRASDVIRVPTLEGVMLAGPGDWIIRGVAGELYPCKDSIFVATHEPADPVPHQSS